MLHIRKLCPSKLNAEMKSFEFYEAKSLAYLDFNCCNDIVSNVDVDEAHKDIILGVDINATNTNYSTASNEFHYQAIGGDYGSFVVLVNDKFDKDFWGEPL